MARRGTGNAHHHDINRRRDWAYELDDDRNAGISTDPERPVRRRVFDDPPRHYDTRYNLRTDEEMTAYYRDETPRPEISIYVARETAQAVLTFLKDASEPDSAAYPQWIPKSVISVVGKAGGRWTVAIDKRFADEHFLDVLVSVPEPEGR